MFTPYITKVPVSPSYSLEGFDICASEIHRGKAPIMSGFPLISYSIAVRLVSLKPSTPAIDEPTLGLDFYDLFRNWSSLFKVKY